MVAALYETYLNVYLYLHIVRIYSQWNAIIRAKFCYNSTPPFEPVWRGFCDHAQTCSSRISACCYNLKTLLFVFSHSCSKCLLACFRINVVYLLQPPAHFCSGSHGATLWVSNALTHFAILYSPPLNKAIYCAITLGYDSRYLALVSALASGADWLFIPEAPPQEGWEDRMCARLEGVRHEN